MEILIEARKPRLAKELAEVWHYRGLLWVLIKRDLTVRYKETWLGVAWAVAQPLAMMLVFWLALGRVLRFSTGDIPYPLFVLCGLIPWHFFSGAVSSSTHSLVGASHLIQKVYFPRLIIPLSTLGAAVMDFALGGIILSLFALWSGHLHAGSLAALIPMLLIALAAVSVGTLSSAMAAAYRDMRHMIPLMMQLWFFATPVIYPRRVLPPNLQWIMDANPMAALVEGFRNALLGLPVNWTACAIATLAFAVLFWFATQVFMTIQRRLADTL